MAQVRPSETEQGAPSDAQRHWFIVGRWQEYDGEWRSNLLRTIAIAAFYVIELLNYYGLNLGWLHIEQTVDRQFHLIASALAAAWVFVAFGTFYCLRIGVFPAALKYLTTGCDILLLTTLLTVADGPRSPLVVGYFLLLAVAALRLELRLVWFATLGSIAGYLFLIGFARWLYVMEDLRQRDLTVPRYAQLIMLVALAMTGITLGQLIRRVKAIAEDYSRRLAAARGDLR